MSLITLNDSKKLGESQTPYIVAEVNTSHFGDIEIAKNMVKKAKEIGCDCVKFQSWTPTSINSKTFYEENPIANRIFKKFSLSEEELLEVVDYCKEVGISFASTPYSREEVDFLVHKCKVPYIKVASMDLNNYLFLDYIARKGIPIVLSTGMGDMDEIRKAVKTIEDAGNKDICILHCISIYPPEVSTMSLKNITGLKKEFTKYPIGFSDHSTGVEVAVAATALGACMIEKHLTLDKSKMGMDNQVALEPEEMKQLVTSCSNVFLSLGNTERVVLKDELEQRKKIRRSIIAAKDLKSGDVLSIEDLDVKRPGTGISPEKIHDLVGKVICRDVEADRLITQEDFR